MKPPKIYFPVTCPLAALLSLVLLAASAVSFPISGKAEFIETFEGIRDDQTIYTKSSGWRKYKAEDHVQPADNTAIVQFEEGRRYVSMTSLGHETANARAFKNVTLPVSGTQNNRISGEIRFSSPGVPMERSTNVLINLNAKRAGEFDPAGSLSMGILVENGEPVFFFSFGSKTQGRITSRADQLTIKPEAWYRFEVVLDPPKGRAEFAVYELAAGGETKVWSGSNNGFQSYAPEEFYQMNLIVTRAGKLESQMRGADFANIQITP